VSETVEGLLASGIMLVFMAGVVRLVFGRTPWAWARARRAAVRTYRIFPDPSAPARPPGPGGSDDPLRECYAVHQDGVRVGALETAYFRIYSGDMRSELRIGEVMYTFVERHGEPGAILRHTTADGRPEPVGAITRPRIARFAAAVRLGQATYTFGTEMYFREYTWTDAARVKLLVARAALIPPKSSEVYSKGLLAAEEEALLAALGFHLFVHENYTHPPH
jgi:hypothetical protein